LSGYHTDHSNQIFFVANTVLFFTYLVPAVYVLHKFRLKLDKGALINIGIYTFSFFTRALMWGLASINDNQDDKNNDVTFRGVMIIMEYLAAFILEISLYFFIFEMMSV